LTPKLLKVLEEKHVPANFFLIGMRAEQSPEIVKQIVEAGHEIGNHTYTHKGLSQLLQKQGEQAVIDEIINGKMAIAKAAGFEDDCIKFLRPPYLDWSEEVAKIVQPIYGDNIMMSGLVIQDWNWGVNNVWDKDDISAIEDHAKHIAETWHQVLGNGTLLGFHDSSEHNLPGNKQYNTWVNRALPTLKAIPYIIDYLTDQGFKIKRLSDMDLVREESVKK